MDEPPRLTAEELQSLYWDILERCVNGRTEGHRCPECSDDLTCELEEDFQVKIECAACRRSITAQVG